MLVCIMLDRPALQVLTIITAIFTARQRSYGKVMFLQTCVCSQGVGYLEREGGRVSRRLGYPGGRVYPPDTLAPSSGTTKVDGTHPTGTLSCYRPQMKFAKVMFLHMSVILFTGGVCGIPACIAGLQAHTQGGS